MFQKQIKVASVNLHIKQNHRIMKKRGHLTG
uniref:Uncharacterized protein n=1 Tax=Arundo donax TaxID=35708 RepID=A0A0A9APD9_ARUDO